MKGFISVFLIVVGAVSILGLSYADREEARRLRDSLDERVRDSIDELVRLRAEEREAYTALRDAAAYLEEIDAKYRLMRRASSEASEELDKYRRMLEKGAIKASEESEKHERMLERAAFEAAEKSQKHARMLENAEAEERHRANNKFEAERARSRAEIAYDTLRAEVDPWRAKDADAYLAYLEREREKERKAHDSVQSSRPVFTVHDSVQSSRPEFALNEAALNALEPRLGGGRGTYNFPLSVALNASDDFMHKFVGFYNAFARLGWVPVQMKSGHGQMYFTVDLAGTIYDLSSERDKSAFEAEIVRLFPTVQHGHWETAFEGKTYTTLMSVTSAPLVVAAVSGVVSDKSRGIYDLRQISDRRDLINLYNDWLADHNSPLAEGPFIFQLDGRFFDVNDVMGRSIFVDYLCRYPWARGIPGPGGMIEHDSYLIVESNGKTTRYDLASDADRAALIRWYNETFHPVAEPEPDDISVTAARINGDVAFIEVEKLPSTVQYITAVGTVITVIDGVKKVYDLSQEHELGDIKRAFLPQKWVIADDRYKKAEARVLDKLLDVNKNPEKYRKQLLDMPLKHIPDVDNIAPEVYDDLIRRELGKMQAEDDQKFRDDLWKAAQKERLQKLRKAALDDLYRREREEREAENKRRRSSTSSSGSSNSDRGPRDFDDSPRDFDDLPAVEPTPSRQGGPPYPINQ